jgi:Zn-dependent peptidase ImmA (M78 family)/transcriptional regulator with XRE-family HTH domain
MLPVNNKKIKYSINPDRLEYLLSLYNLSQEDFLHKLNITQTGELRKKTLDLNWLSSVIYKNKALSLVVIKRICKIFEVNISWIISKYDPVSKDTSILFRKKKFNADLDFTDKKIINKLERFTIEAELLKKYIQYKPQRQFKKYNYLEDDAKKIATFVANKFFNTYQSLEAQNYIKKANGARDYLSNLIRVLEKYSIFVFERVETWNQKERLNVDGLFMDPNFIFIKRNQTHFRREIFTLIHEFAHYLLNIEEIDSLDKTYSYDSLNKIENWCHSFSFYFLVHKERDLFSRLDSKSMSFDDDIKKIYGNTFLSHRALYTSLYLEAKLDKKEYDKRIKELDQYIADDEEKYKQKKEISKSLGVQGGRAPQAIKSNIFAELVKINYVEGNISEHNLREYLKIKPTKSIVNIL